MDYAAYTTADFDHSPLMFYYETTTACDLVCKHCRASAQENPDPGSSARNKASSCCRKWPSSPSGRWSCSPAATR